MEPIRILHISDLHLAQQPSRRSPLDRSSDIKTAVRKALLSDIKDSILNGNLNDVRAAFKDLFDNESVQALQDALQETDRQRMNAAIDQVLAAIVLGNGTFRNLIRETLRDLALATSYDPGLLDCLGNFIEQEDSALDALIITGDLATTGLQVDLEKGLDFLEGPSTQSISSIVAPRLLLPGNHDRFVYTGKGFLYAPGGQLFDTIFKDYWSGYVKAYEPLRNGRLSVGLIAADFGLQSKNDSSLPHLKISRLAQGRVYETILTQLVNLTRQFKTEERAFGNIPVVLWAVHFPPFFVHQRSGKVAQAVYNLAKNLIDEKNLVAEAKNENVYAILCGHTHEAQDYREQTSKIRVLCAGGATAYDAADKQCQIIEVSLNHQTPRVEVIEYEPDTSHTTFRPIRSNYPNKLLI